MAGSFEGVLIAARTNFDFGFGYNVGVGFSVGDDVGAKKVFHFGLPGLSF